MKMPMESKPSRIGWVARCSHTATSDSGTHGSGFQPPRKSSTNTPEPISMCEYSATKNRPHFIAPYSVWKPPTRSASPSAMSNGRRLVSAKSATRKTIADSGIQRPNHAPFWAETTSNRLSVPLPPGALTQRNTGSTESVIESS